MPHIIVPVVGAHFRPPAKVLIAIMPTGHALQLRPEPTNPYDENAIAVWAKADAIPTDLIVDNMPAFEGAGDAPDLENLGGMEGWQATYRQLGYVARVDTDKVRGLQSDSNGFWDATIGFDGAGKPTAKVEDAVAVPDDAVLSGDAPSTSEELDIVTRSHQDAIDRSA